MQCTPFMLQLIPRRLVRTAMILSTFPSPDPVGAAISGLAWQSQPPVP